MGVQRSTTKPIKNNIACLKMANKMVSRSASSCAGSFLLLLTMITIMFEQAFSLVNFASHSGRVRNVQSSPCSFDLLTPSWRCDRRRAGKCVPLHPSFNHNSNHNHHYNGFLSLASEIPNGDVTSDQEDEDGGDEEEEETSTTAAAAAAATVIGIGGEGGLVYDVNKLKRNRVQEIVRDYKGDLLEVLAAAATDKRVDRLSSSSSVVVDEKILSLLQANPVITTTDSNLLDGHWFFTYASRPLLAKKTQQQQQRSPPQSLVKKRKTKRATISRSSSRPPKVPVVGIFRTSTRDVCLEDLRDEEDAYVVDRTRVLGGLLSFETHYAVAELTRTDLMLRKNSQRNFFLGRRFYSRDVSASSSPPTTRHSSSSSSSTPRLGIKILYLDSDLCISTTELGSEGPLLLYTKNESWSVRRQRRERKLRWLRDSLSRMRRSVSGVGDNDGVVDSSSPSASPLLSIGEVDEKSVAKSSTTWSVDEDPFAHFSPRERFEAMKGMSLEQIEQERQRELIKNQKLRKKRSKPKPFKKPEMPKQSRK